MYEDFSSMVHLIAFEVIVSIPDGSLEFLPAPLAPLPETGAVKTSASTPLSLGCYLFCTTTVHHHEINYTLVFKATTLVQSVVRYDQMHQQVDQEKKPEFEPHFALVLLLLHTSSSLINCVHTLLSSW